MKKKLLVLTTAMIIAFSATFAKDTKSVPAFILTELHQKFADANDVQWKTTANYYEAAFTINGHPLKEFYSFDGELIGMSRQISVDQLPMALIPDVKEKSATSKITDLFELLKDRGTEYYITYQGDKGTQTYKSTSDYWTRY
jgi:hypothetical protein